MLTPYYLLPVHLFILLLATVMGLSVWLVIRSCSRSRSLLCVLRFVSYLRSRKLSL